MLWQFGYLPFEHIFIDPVNHLFPAVMNIKFYQIYVLIRFYVFSLNIAMPFHQLGAISDYSIGGSYPKVYVFF
jgi:hypothetical protein